MRFKSDRFDRRVLAKVAIPAVLMLCLSGCAAPLYTVAPLPKTAPPEKVSATAGNLEVTALALSDERAMQQFDANLPLAGVIAVEVRLSNRSNAPIAVSSLRISLVDSSGRALKAIASKKALGRVMKHYGVRLYGKEAYARTVESYAAIALSLEADLDPSSERAGIVFFEHKGPAIDMSGYRLSIEGGPSSISLQLN